MIEKFDPQETYVVLDLDRTLIDTELINKTYEKIVAESSNDLSEAMNLAKQADEAAGRSFDPHLFVREALLDSVAIMNDFEVELTNRLNGRDDVLNPGALELIDQLKTWGVAHGILTYGHSEWQRIKLQVSGLDRKLPSKITADKHKGAEIGSWQSDTGEFHVPVELTSHEIGAAAVYQTVVLVDDKAVSFEDLPDGVKGIWYRPSEHLLLSQQGDVPATVTVVDHLDLVKDNLRSEFNLAA